jgi:hypothetical protein
MSKLPKDFELPPPSFSNAMNDIYKDWDCRNWKGSKEWRLFNAGKEAAALDIVSDANAIVRESGAISRNRGPG